MKATGIGQKNRRPRTCRHSEGDQKNDENPRESILTTMMAFDAFSLQYIVW